MGGGGGLILPPPPLPHRRCHLTASWASSQSPSSPWPGLLQRGYRAIIRLIMAASRRQLSCNETNGRARRSIVSLILGAVAWLIIRKFQPPPGHSPGLFVTRLPDVDLSGLGPDSSTNGRNGGRHDPLSPFSLDIVACLQVSNLTITTKPLAQPSLWRFHLFREAGFVQVPSLRYPLPGETTAPAAVSGAQTIS